MLNPRDYQIELCRDAWRAMFAHQHSSTLMVAPTGSGKTVTGTFLVEKFLEHRKQNVLVTAHRREIVEQTAAKMHEAGLGCSIIMAGKVYDPGQPVQIASIDTLRAWKDKPWFDMPKIGLLWIDECHRAMSPGYQKLAAFYQSEGVKILGTTATPIRADGVGLGRMFDSMVRSPSISWMIEHGYLVPPRYKVGIVPDLKGVKLTAAEYNQHDLEEVMNQEKLIGDVVDNWLLHARDRCTMVFASGVSHSRNLVKRFREHGIEAEHIDGNTPKDVRERIAQRLLRREVRVICNAMVYVEGTDIPWIDCVTFAQPSKSLGKYLQQGGRGLRPWEGKSDCLFLDHAGVVNAHGRLELDRDWQLVDGKEMLEPLRKQRNEDKALWPCPNCHELYRGPECPRCHTPTELKGVPRDAIKAVLMDLTQAEYEQLASPGKKPALPPRVFYAQLLGWALRYGKKPGLAYYVFQEKFKIEPNFRGVVPIEPGDEVMNYMKYRAIRFARGRQSSVRPKGVSHAQQG